MPKTEKPAAVTAKKPPKKRKGKRGSPYRPTAGQRRALVQYVRESGYHSQSLAEFLEIAKSTFLDLLKRDKRLSNEINHANTEFRRALVKLAKPEFILKNKFPEEFTDDTKLKIEHGFSEKLQKVLDQQIKLIEEGSKEIRGTTLNTPTSK